MNDELETIDRAFETALVEGQIDALDALLTDDFTYVHGDAWTRGDPPLRVDDKAAIIRSSIDGSYTHRTTVSCVAEVHGEIGIVEGSYDAGLRTPKGIVEFFVRYLRVYRHDGRRWTLVTHRSVHGPEFQT